MPIKANDLKQAMAFYKMPKVLFTDDTYSDLSSNAKLMYMLLFDRLSLSIDNGWIDERGCVYQFYTVNQLMYDLDCSNKTIISIKKELIDKGLLEEKRQGLNKPNMLFLESVKNTPRKCKNYTSDSVKNGSTDVKNLHPIKTDIIKTKGTKTESPRKGGSGSIISSIGTPPTTPPIFSQEYKKLYEAFEQELGLPLSQFQREELGYMLEDFEDDLILEALREAVKHGKANFAYIQSILKRWKSDRLMTVDLVRNSQRKNTTKHIPRNHENWQPSADEPF